MPSTACRAARTTRSRALAVRLRQSTSSVASARRSAAASASHETPVSAREALDDDEEVPRIERIERLGDVEPVDVAEELVVGVGRRTVEAGAGHAGSVAARCGGSACATVESCGHRNRHYVTTPRAT